MGADLYIESVFGRQEKEWKRPFDEAVLAREKLRPGTTEYDHAHRRVRECYERMFAAGYFRDSYNASSLLWQFGLSWWTDVTPLCDDEHYLQPAGVTKFLGLLSEREDTFHDNLSGLEPDEAAAFDDEYARLRAFLGQAIALNEPIRCSL